MPKDSLSELVGVDVSALHARERRDGIIEFRGRIGPREVEGQYDPLTFHLKYSGQAEDGGGITADVRGKTHAETADRLRSLLAWLRGQDPPEPE